MTEPTLIGGRYELGELIGYGGMAEVHRGRDSRLGRDVAIKMLRADLARDPSFLNRFRREAQAAAGLNHPAIVAVYDTGQDTAPDGTARPYIVMEYVEGRTLREILKTEHRLPARRAMEIAADVCAALDFSHKNGLIHRDVKPANVMITSAGAVKVMDFGIARAVADNGATVTQTANVIGTAQYLSPEQARGETVDPRSDVYSTGCLLYELATGVPPFQGDSPVAVAYQHVRENATAPTTRVPDLPRALDSIVMKALAKNQLNRYQTAAEMRADLQRALANQPVNAEAVMTDAERTQFIARTPPPPIGPGVQRPGGPPMPPPEPEDERHTALIWIAVVIALLLVVGIGAFLLWNAGRDDHKTQTYAVPSVIGKSIDDATSAFTARNLKLLPDTPSPATSSKCDNGALPTSDTPKIVCHLIDSDNQQVTLPLSVPAGTAFYYQYFALDMVNVPAVVGESYTAAAKDLKQSGLQIKPQQVNSTAPAGQVTAQHPHVNASVVRGSTVRVSVSTGKVKLPNVQGMKLDKAIAQLNAAGFTNIADPERATTSDQGKDQQVFYENPTPDITYAPNQQIKLKIYHYVAPVTCVTPPPSSPSGGPSGPSGAPSGPTSGSSSSSGQPVCTTGGAPSGTPSS